MTLTIGILGIFALSIVGIYATDSRQTAKLRGALDDRAADLETYREHVMEISAAFANTAGRLALRESDERRLVLDALISDRNRLVTAVLAGGGSSPAAATLLARADQLDAGNRRQMNVRDLFDEAQGSRVLGGSIGVDTEFETSDGEPIHPVGLG